MGIVIFSRTQVYRTQLVLPTDRINQPSCSLKQLIFFRGCLLIRVSEKSALCGLLFAMFASSEWNMGRDYEHRSADGIEYM